MPAADSADDQAAALAQDGRNRLQGLVGPLPDAALTLRSVYLNWAEQVERLLRKRGAVDADREAALHSPRHRDIVSGSVPHDVLTREVLAERDLRLRMLEALTDDDGGEPADGEPQRGVWFQGREGENYAYFPDRPLGRGGYGQVFAATTVDGLDLAVKRVLLRGDNTRRWYEDGRLAERELDVARRLGPLTDENVLPVLDDALEIDALLLVMPRADHSLADLLVDGGRLDEAATRHMLLDVARGLRHLADRGVVHRDIKPGNIVWWCGRWVLADLGIARVLEEDTGTYSWAGTGTHAYWAPELFAFEPATGRSDLYALGCTAFEALTGTKPFTGEDLAAAHRGLVPELPALGDTALDRTVRRLLAKDVAARPADAREVQQLLVPLSGLGPDQVALLRAAARDARRVDEDGRRGREADQEEARRRDARTSFATVWDDTIDRAREVLPDADGREQADTWFLTALNGRLSVQLAQPSGSRAAVLIGLVKVMLLDDPQESTAANVRCRHVDGRQVWELLTFTHNMISPERPPLGPRKADLPAGMGLSNLDRLLERLDEPGPPVVITESQSLTPQALLQVLADELSP